MFPCLLTAQTPQDTVALIRRAVTHREQDAAHHAPLRYELRNQSEHRDTTKLIIETKDGDVARLIALDGKPLDPTATQAELDRLHNLLDHPELQQKRHHAEIKDDQRVSHLMHMLPDALLYHPQGTVPCGTHQCYKLSFEPNPAFTPPDLEANIFRGVAGSVLIDAIDERITRIDAHFIDQVDFGLGLLGKVNKGGTALLEQTDIGVHDYEVTALRVRMSGKALLFRTFNVVITEEATNFSPVPADLDYKQAIHMLEAP